MKKNSKKTKSRIQKFEKKLRNFLILFFALFVIGAQIFFSFQEGKMGLVAGDATNSIVVTVNVVSSISIDSPLDVTLSPNIQETGVATGNVTWNVETNNADGWELKVNASEAPAMTSGANSFADYTEGTPGTPESWSMATNASEFGFNATGTYAESGFSGSRYLGFDGTNQIRVASRAAASSGGGDDTTINFQAEVGTGHSQPLGTYTATITATATTL